MRSRNRKVKTADGVVRGAYSYVDSDGIVQTVNYIADALGFRVGATNLPVHHVEPATAPVAAPAAAPVAAPAAAPVEETVAAETPVQAPVIAAYSAPVITPDVSYSYLP